MKRKEISREVLELEYCQNRLTYKTIAEKLGCSRDTVMQRAKSLGIKSRPSGRNITDIRGKRFGSLTVLDRVDTDNHKHPLFACKCDCGEYVKRTPSSLLSKGEKMCWMCRNKFISTKKWKGVGEISGDFWYSIKKSAAARNLEFGITIKEVWDLFLGQNRTCALSGVELTFRRNKKGDSTASLDRIDSAKGYTMDNVQWVHKVLNNIKMDLSQHDFLNWCKAITEHQKI